MDYCAIVVVVVVVVDCCLLACNLLLFVSAEAFRVRRWRRLAVERRTKAAMLS